MTVDEKPMTGYDDLQASVGRQRERETLAAALARAASGHGGVVLVSGEAGVGKSHLVETFGQQAATAGAAVYWGWNHPTSGAPAYWPWIQVERSAAAGRGSTVASGLLPAPERDREDVGGGGAPGTGDAGRFHLFEKFTAFLRRESETGPWLIILEDIHWADEPTLDLLVHVAWELPRMPVLVVATARDEEDDLGPAAVRTIASLTRDPGLTRVELRPFDLHEVAEYAAQIIKRVPSESLTNHLWDATGGNAFILSQLLSDPSASRQRDVRSGSAPLLPEGVRYILRERLERLPAVTLPVLQTAAVLGKEFDAHQLGAVEEMDQATLAACVDTAIHWRVLYESGAHRFRFVHALMREAVLSTLSPNARRQIHGRVAESLESSGAQARAESIPVLAHHYWESTALQPVHAQQAYRYARDAAELAESQFAWSDAVRHYERCLELQPTVEPSNVERIHLLTRLATNQQHLTDPATLDTARTAMELCRSEGDWNGFALAALTVLEHPSTWDNNLTVSIAEAALARIDEGETELRCALLAQLVEYYGYSDPYRADDPPCVRLARSLHDSQTLRLKAALHAYEASRARVRGDFDTARSESMEAHLALDAIGQYMLAGIVKGHCNQALTAQALLTEAIEGCWEHLSYGVQRRIPHPVSEASLDLAHIGVLKNDPHLVEQAERRAEEAGVTLSLYSALRRAELGGSAGHLVPAMESLHNQMLENDYHKDMHAAHGGTAARVYHNAGMASEAAAELERWFDDYRFADSFDPGYVLRAILGVSDALVAIGTSEMQAMVYRRLKILGHYRLQGWSGLDHLRVDLARKLGLPGEARDWYDIGLEWSTREGCPVEQGLNLQGLGELEALQGNVPGALALMERAAEYLASADAILYLRPLQIRLGGLRALPVSGEVTDRPGNLTNREIDIVRLVATGASNRAIADALYISQPTVARHIANVLAKLDMANRTEIAAWAVQHGIGSHSK